MKDTLIKISQIPIPQVNSDDLAQLDQLPSLYDELERADTASKRFEIQTQITSAWGKLAGNSAGKVDQRLLVIQDEGQWANETNDDGHGHQVKTWRRFDDYAKNILAAIGKNMSQRSVQYRLMAMRKIVHELGLPPSVLPKLIDDKPELTRDLLSVGQWDNEQRFVGLASDAVRQSAILALGMEANTSDRTLMVALLRRLIGLEHDAASSLINRLTHRMKIWETYDQLRLQLIVHRSQFDGKATQYSQVRFQLIGESIEDEQINNWLTAKT